MSELKAASKKIYEKSNHKVVGAGFDSLSNYYVLGMKDEGVNFSKDINFTGSKSKKVINYYADGIKDGYFKTAGSAGYLSCDFSTKKIAMFVGTSAGKDSVKMVLVTSSNMVLLLVLLSTTCNRVLIFTCLTRVLLNKRQLPSCTLSTC